MIEIHHTALACAPVAAAFDYVDDYRHVPSWMFGITKFDPIGDHDQGLGAVYDAAMKVGPKTLDSVVKVTGWERNSVIELESIDGLYTHSRWQFEPAGETETRMTVDFRYDLPGGLAGKALGKLIEPFVAQAIRHTDATLRRQVEQSAKHSS
ncbi:SRPBCC family protein [Rhodococcus opacus]|uniref:SRPBCC family protein n=1 Tax=Rhodococcus opacus TaxID=37919 RepID=UPI0006BB4EE9|nr:SRPBCC family protein [Rhodococcus opacus]MDV6246648.1 SRPBCC family protein [Rhodococcus opacus]